ncbi:hypothetical protein EI94DRAFT_1807736 [Lactarius quietus]|nr:hypothetical protein EI94DRAFT_1807736 [Lactarius quietus]
MANGHPSFRYVMDSSAPHLKHLPPLSVRSSSDNSASYKPGVHELRITQSAAALPEVLAPAFAAQSTTGQSASHDPRLRTSTSASVPGPDSSPSSSPAIKPSVRRHEMDRETPESVEGRRSPKRQKIERTTTPILTPTSSPSAPAPVVVDTQDTVGVGKTPTSQSMELSALQ